MAQYYDPGPPRQSSSLRLYHSGRQPPFSSTRESPIGATIKARRRGFDQELVKCRQCEHRSVRMACPGERCARGCPHERPIHPVPPRRKAPRGNEERGGRVGIQIREFSRAAERPVGGWASRWAEGRHSLAELLRAGIPPFPPASRMGRSVGAATGNPSGVRHAPREARGFR